MEGFSLKGKLGFTLKYPKKSTILNNETRQTMNNKKEWALLFSRGWMWIALQKFEKQWKNWYTGKLIFKKFSWTQSHRNLLEPRRNPVWVHRLSIQPLLINYLLLLHVSVGDVLLKRVLRTRVKYSLSADFCIQSRRNSNELRLSLKGSLKNIWTHNIRMIRGENYSWTIWNLLWSIISRLTINSHFRHCQMKINEYDDFLIKTLIIDAPTLPT